MQISINRDELLKPLSYVAGVVERRQTLPILSNVRLRYYDDVLELTGTDLEVEVVTTIKLDGQQEGEATIPARKLYDICRALPAQAEIRITLDGERARVQSGRSRFTLVTLPSTDFPSVEVGAWDLSLNVAEADLKRLLDKTQFCMAHQDVRYYLNGLLLELKQHSLRAVATDGHRMGLSELKLKESVSEDQQAIVPRKGVQEISRFLDSSERQAALKLSRNHVQVSVASVILTSKLIDGRFPDYTQVMPSSHRNIARIDRLLLREALGRAAILANEKYRGVRLTLSAEKAVINAHNPEQEEAQEEVEAVYNGEELEIGFNVNYVIEAINGLEGQEVELGLNDANSSCTLQTPDQPQTRYIVMPMRL
ncbi:MAG: DNA polymerase III subunit beta [Gammaproteobacteria bacterium]|nr:DNA polymerase III subunit beta [Gammaproteobacteria bacterium]